MTRSTAAVSESTNLRSSLRRLSTGRIGLVGLLLFVALTGCVGSIGRDQFDAEIQSRGGGLSGDLLLDAVVAVERRVGNPPLWVRSASVSPRSVYLEVSPNDRREEVDSWFWNGSTLRGPEPESNLDEEELLPHFTSAVLDPEIIERAIDDAVAQSGLRGAYASSLRLEGTDAGTFRASVSVTNERDTEVWYFGPEGTISRTAP